MNKYLKIILPWVLVNIVLLWETLHYHTSSLDFVFRWMEAPGIIIILFFTGQVHNYSEIMLFIINSIFYLITIYTIQRFIEKRNNLKQKK